MPITRLIPPPFTALSGEQPTRPLPPLPIHGDNELFASFAPPSHIAVIRPSLSLSIIDDDEISPSALSPPPMYGDDTSVPLSIVSQRTDPLRPATISSVTRTSFPIPCTPSSRVLPLPPLRPASAKSARPLRPRCSAGRDIKSGFFTEATDFVLNHPKFTETITYMYMNEKAVFDILEPRTMLDATKDSNARYPPPQCHPTTRLMIKEKLTNWFMHELHEWKVFWIYGLAGTGTSAVAQTFADFCGDWKKLGGTYFFSKLAGRNKPETVIPTLAYQLAIFVPGYKSLISTELANDPLILHSSPPVQFKRLIVEPFATLQRERHRDPIIIILDGLDECEGQNAQLMILDMISDSLRTVPDLPLRWLIFSRPDRYLKLKFIQIMECSCEEIVIETECRDEVERFVRKRILEIKAAYYDVMPRSWPSQDELCEIFDGISGRSDIALGRLGNIVAFWDARYNALKKLEGR